MNIGLIDLILEWIITTPGIIAKNGDKIKPFKGKHVDDNGFSVRVPKKYSIVEPVEILGLPDECLEKLCIDLGLLEENPNNNKDNIIQIIDELHLDVNDIEFVIDFIRVQTGADVNFIIDTAVEYLKNDTPVAFEG